MKRSNLLIFSVLLAVGVMTGCKDKEPEVIKPVQLETPVLSLIDGNIVGWSAVENATGYLTEVNGTEGNQSVETRIDLSSYGVGDHTLRVKAVGNDKTFTDSEWSDTFSHSITSSLAVPSVNVNGHKVSWTAVEHATSYEYKVNDGAATQTDKLEIDFTAQPANTYSVVVRALSTNELYASSTWSEAVVVTITGLLATPVLSVIEPTFSSPENAQISWEEIDNATGYEITVDGQTVENRGTILYMQGNYGTHAVTVKAVNTAQPTVFPASEAATTSITVNDYGDGTQATPYKIYSAADWAAFARVVNTTATAAYTEQYVALGADIDFKNETITAVGVSTTKNFGGTFDGANHTLSNAKVGSSELSNQGVFTCVSGTIRNLVLDNITVTSSASAMSRSAVLSSGQTSGSFYDCTVKNSSVSAPAAANSYAAGLVSSITAATSVISGCKVENTTVTAAHDLVAAIVAYVQDGKVINCVSKNNTVNARRYAGGITGSMNGGVVVNCQSLADKITVSASYVGGIVGYLPVGNCINNLVDGTTVANTSTDANQFIGLLVGGDKSGATGQCKNNVVRSGSIKYGSTAPACVGIIAGRRLSSSTLLHNYYAASLTASADATDNKREINSVGYTYTEGAPLGVNTQGGSKAVAADGTLIVEEVATPLAAILNQNIDDTYTTTLYPDIVKWTTGNDGWPTLNY